MPPGAISQCKLPGYDHQPMAAAGSMTVHTLYLTNQAVQPSQSAQTGTYTPDTCLPPNLAPNLFHILDEQLSLTLTRASDSAVQSLSRGREPVHYPGLLPSQGAHTALQNGTCRPCNIPGAAIARALLKIHKQEVCSTTQLHPTSSVTSHSFKETQSLSDMCGSQNMNYGGF